MIEPDPLKILEDSLTAEGSPYALQEEAVRGSYCRSFRRGPRSILDIYIKASSFGEALLAVYGDTSLTYRAAFADAGKFAASLKTRFALAKADRVGIALPNRLEVLVAFIAVTLAGGTPVLMESRNDEFHHRNCAMARCRLLIAMAQSGPGATAVDPTSCSGIRVENLVTGESVTWAECLSHEGLPRSSWVHAGTDEDALIALTSGTSGRPKGVVHTHLGVVTGLMNMMLAGNFANPTTPRVSQKTTRPSRPCVLLLAPFAHVSGYTQLLLLMMLGGCLVLGQALAACEIADVVARRKVRSIVGLTPGTARRLLSFAAQYDLGSLGSFHVNGFALHENLVAAVAATLPQVVVGTSYGMTETGGSICALAGEALRERPQSCGRVLPTVDVRVTGTDGREMPAGQVGEIWIRGAMLLREYCGQGNEALGDGWLRTGDLGYVEVDRFLTVVDRLSDTITIDGRRISCLDIERALLRSHDLDEVAVFAVTEAGRAILSIAAVAGRQEPDLESIRSLVRAEAGVECVIVLHEELPRNSSGKVNYTTLSTLQQLEGHTPHGSARRNLS